MCVYCISVLYSIVIMLFYKHTHSAIKRRQKGQNEKKKILKSMSLHGKKSILLQLESGSCMVYGASIEWYER